MTAVTGHTLVRLERHSGVSVITLDRPSRGNALVPALLADLQAALDSLAPEFRAAVVLCDIEGLSYEEMADVLGISKGTVMSRLFHARKNLQALLRPYVDAGEGVPESLQLAVSGAA